MQSNLHSHLVFISAQTLLTNTDPVCNHYGTLFPDDHASIDVAKRHKAQVSTLYEVARQNSSKENVVLLRKQLDQLRSHLIQMRTRKQPTRILSA